MEVETLISLFSTGFIIFLIIAVLGIGFAAFMFFRYKIPVVYSQMTGRAQKKSVEQMKSSGVLRSDEEKERDKIYAGPGDSGGMKTEDYETQEFNPDAAIQEAAAAESAVETTILEAEQATTVLEAEQIMYQKDGQTMDLHTYMAQHTSEADDITDSFGSSVVPDSEESYESAGETVLLNRNEEPAPEVRFECIEHMMITHTDEVI